MSGKVIAHRGASRMAAENSLEAFQKAIDLGADGLEFDVRLSRDGVMVVVHDDELDGALVRHLTRSQIAHLRPGIPTLEEVLSLAKNRIWCDVELKEQGYERAAVELVLRYCDRNAFMISSFHERSIRIVRRMERDVACGLLVGGKKPLRYGPQWVARWFPLSRAKAVGAGVVVIHWKLLRAGFLTRAAGAGISVLVWTVDETPLLRRLLADDRIAGVITNIPDVALIERATL